MQKGQTCCLDVYEGLQTAAVEGDLEAIRGLLECPDADINFSDNDGRTLLYLSTLHGHTQAVNELLEHSLHDVGGEAEGLLLLHLASIHGHTNLAEHVLVRYKLDIDRGRSRDGGTAFSIAAEKGHSDILKLLIAHDEPADVNKGWCASNWTPQLILCDLRNDQALKVTTPTTMTTPAIGSQNS